MSGKKKRTTKLFRISKRGINDNARSSFMGEPNTFEDSYDKSSGRFRRRRKFNESGYAYIDLDVSSDKHPYDHKHIIVGNDRIGGDPNLSKKEKGDFGKMMTKDDIEFLNDIRAALGVDSLSEVDLIYKGKAFSIEPEENKFVVYGFEKPLSFNTVDDVFNNLLLDGKPFIERLNDIMYD
jgi:hypothetical protein